MAQYQKVALERPGRADLLAIIGSLAYGTADEPRDEQIQRGMKYFPHQRRRQREMHARITMLRGAVRDSETEPE